MKFEQPPVPPQETPENGEELSSTLQEIQSMPLNLDDDAFNEAARSDTESMTTSADAFLRIAKQLTEGEEPGPNTWGSMLRILERDSMKEHPQIEVFKKAVQELADKAGHELKLPEGYGDKPE